MSFDDAPAKAVRPPPPAEPVEWRQGESEEDVSLEVTVKVVLPAGAQWRDLHVTVGDSQVVIVKWKDAVVLQWRLHDEITNDVTWRGEDGHLILEMTKKEGSTWTALLSLPLVDGRSAGWKSEAELSLLLQTETQPLPPVPAAKKKQSMAVRPEEIETSSSPGSSAAAAPVDGSAPESTAETAAVEAVVERNVIQEAPADSDEAAPEVKQHAASEKATADRDSADVDLDALLDEAIDEAEAADVEDPSKYPAVMHELASFAEELTLMSTKLQELRDEAAKATAATTGEEDDAKIKDLHHQIAIIERMIQVTHTVRETRTKPQTMAVFREIQTYDLLKSRLNSGSLDDEEMEAFASDEERNMTPHELFQHGVTALREGQVPVALHFLRLGAIHHDHQMSVGLLHRMYTELRAPAKAAYFILRRANSERDIDAASNVVVAELFDRGVRHFPPLLACAIHYYQRAASVGATSAMIGLAQLYIQGGCSRSLSDDEVREANKSPELFQTWLNHAIVRGNPDAYFIQSTLFISGENGTAKSAANAAKFFDLARKANPAKMQRAAGLLARIEELKKEEAAGASSSDLRGASGASPVAASRPATAAAPAATPATASAPTSPATVAGGSQATNQRLTTTAAGQGTVAQVGGGAGGRVRAMEQHAPAARGAAPLVATTRRQGGMLGSRWKSTWERTARWSAMLYFVYALSFPLRVLALPYFYGVVQSFKDAIGQGGGGSMSSSGGGFGRKPGGMF
mgnify:FL=1